MPRLHGKTIKSESLGTGPDLRIFKSSPGGSNVQPGLRKAALCSVVRGSRQLALKQGEKATSLEEEQNAE